ncbi:aminotransferase class I/II-fold pyridoxal phosphate-dependent enzyme [Maribius pontilimi]|uniref:Aminotransferase class I/II-fold pyridoxal phosphate-dependent enzyme n=2 Tax=Palleronia pontilimi TaxID=1964209 RepID=A0A934IGH7_9RHOB|nr:aminotransferase class I/II-fold pyridoxal phosphate-dependent enzyme [Palleronia pontilimi]MBJ3762155.1 aminotransferase class I/II-fold pyridoxal phosphate-dependent enzyme [Palleronia pontilimi]
MQQTRSGRIFRGSFTQQEPIPEAGIAAAVDILRSGRLHRYNLAGDERGMVAELEFEYAAWQGARHCLAVTSGGQAMQIALRALGLGPGARVLSNAFTLAPVPGAIAAVGAQAVLVECDEELCIDLGDLERKAENHECDGLLLSHMRGHLCDMDKLMAICARHGLIVIEDCAHTMGARWDGRLSGQFGHAACFSTQTYKHMNSGEGGFLTTADPEVMARATILSGSYMNYAHHGAGPEPDAFVRARLEMPNCSARMDAVRAAILRAQLIHLDDNIARWSERHEVVRARLDGVAGVALPRPLDKAMRVGSSFQFRLPRADAALCRDLIAGCEGRGVVLKWFGAPDPVGFTSNHASWRYMQAQDLPQTDRILSTLFDMRLPLTFSLDDCALIGDIIAEEIAALGLAA